MADRPPRNAADSDVISLRFVFVPDGAPIPDIVQDFRDPIVLRARFEPEPRAPNELQTTDNADPASVAIRRGIATRIPGAYDMAQNGSGLLPSPRPSGLNPEQRNAVVVMAQSWVAARVPYAPSNTPLAGSHASLAGADCSGAVYAIYRGAGIPIEYFDTQKFPNNPSFTALPFGTAPEMGDVLWWPGHVAIHAGENGGDGYKMWTATSPGGQPFGWSLSKYQWGSMPAGTPPIVYRYNGK